LLTVSIAKERSKTLGKSWVITRRDDVVKYNYNNYLGNTS